MYLTPYKYCVTPHRVIKILVFDLWDSYAQHLTLSKKEKKDIRECTAPVLNNNY